MHRHCTPAPSKRHFTDWLALRPGAPAAAPDSLLRRSGGRLRGRRSRHVATTCSAAAPREHRACDMRALRTMRRLLKRSPLPTMHAYRLLPSELDSSADAWFALMWRLPRTMTHPERLRHRRRHAGAAVRHSLARRLCGSVCALSERWRTSAHRTRDGVPRKREHVLPTIRMPECAQHESSARRRRACTICSTSHWLVQQLASDAPATLNYNQQPIAAASCRVTTAPLAATEPTRYAACCTMDPARKILCTTCPQEP